MQLRTALQPGDIGEIIRLHGCLYAEEYGWDYTFEAYVAESLARFALQHDPLRERIWIVDEASAVQGSVGIVDAANAVAQLRWFLLTPAVRGQGIGRQMIDAALEFTRQAGYQSVFLWTVEGLAAAAHLYLACGFELTEERAGVHWGKHVNEQRFELHF